MSRILRGEVEAETTSIDYFCLFHASIMGDGEVAFKSDDENEDY